MNLFNELKRRNVFRVGIAYVVVAWLVMQVADVVINNIGAPDWLFQAILLVLGLGFPMVLIFAWAFELTPEGVKREKEVDRSQSITRKTGRKLDFTIIAVLALVAVYFIWESRFQSGGTVGPGSISPGEISQAESSAKGELTLTPDIIRDNSIAVLPFANRSNQDDDLFFTDGIHDDLLTQLAKITGLKVISRTSVMEYRDTTKKIPEIAAELGVSTILEGGIQRAGKRIRINAQLIDVSTDEHLWAETFDREMTVENIFDIQSEITRQIVTAVRGELTDEEANVLAQLPTNNLEAYEAYLHARSFINLPDYTQQKYRDAEPWLAKAVELDPEFALAWVLLVDTNAQAIWMGYDDSPERLQQLRDALSKATEYGPFLPETLAARAEYLYRIENNFHEAEIALRAASKAKPGDANLIERLAYTLRRTGQWEEAISSFQLAFELDPANVRARSSMAETLLRMRDFDRVEPLIDAWMEKYPQALSIKAFKVWLMIWRDGDLASARNLLDQIEPIGANPYNQAITFLPLMERDYQAAMDIYEQPNYLLINDQPEDRVFDLVGRSSVYSAMGNSKKAEELAKSAIDLFSKLQAGSGSDRNNAQKLGFLAYAYAQSGELAKALEAANQARALMPESRDSYNGTDYSVTRAWILALSGERDEALSEIERLLSIPSGLNRWELYLDPGWDFLRDDERFNELIRPPNLKEGGV